MSKAGKNVWGDIMSVIIADCLKLPALREAKVVAGSLGIKNVVSSISVLENSDVTAIAEDLFMGNEIVISAFFSIKDDVEAQCLAIRRLHEMGEVGLILYYLGIIMSELDERVIQTADELEFPLICMPVRRYDLRYSEVICEVMEAIFKDRMKETQYINEMLERISSLQDHQRNMNTVLRMICDRIRCSLLLTDRTFNILNSATWPMAATLNTHEVIACYRDRPTVMLEDQPVKLFFNDQSNYLFCLPVIIENRFNMNLIILDSTGAISLDSCKQAAEVIRLFVSIWKLDHGKEGSAELLRSILNDEPLKMRRLAEILHINISAIHIMWVLKSKDDNLTEKKQTLRNTRLLILTRRFLQENHRMAVVDIYNGNVIAFMDSPAYPSLVYLLAEAYMEEIEGAKEKLTLAICTDLENTADVRTAYMLIGEHLKSAKFIYPHKAIITIHEIQFACSCHEVIRGGEEAIASALLPLRPLRNDEAQQDQQLVTTLATFMLDAQTNVVETAQLLFLHKNTIKYRIKKINERLNYDVIKLPESYKLYMAVALERLLKGLE